MSSSINSTVRVSGVFAIGGGLVASAGFAQSAQAAGGAQAPTVSVSQVAANHTTQVATAPAAVSQINDAVTANTRISAVRAKTYTAPVTPSSAADSSDATSSTPASSARRSATEPAGTSPSAQRTAARDTSSRDTSSRAISSRVAPPRKASAEPAAPQQNVPAATGGVIGIAKQYIGVPYVYGGSTPSGFDCSGFTGYVFAKMGVKLPRTARAQQAAVAKVSNPQPGDLVFFGSPAHHIGIYLGNGMMIAAPKPGDRVKIQPVYGSPSGYGRP